MEEIVWKRSLWVGFVGQVSERMVLRYSLLATREWHFPRAMTWEKPVFRTGTPPYLDQRPHPPLSLSLSTSQPAASSSPSS